MSQRVELRITSSMFINIPPRGYSRRVSHSRGSDSLRIAPSDIRFHG
jgi:hypothetical protein